MIDKNGLYLIGLDRFYILHINSIIADNNFVLALINIVFVILIFPIFVNINLKFNIKNKRLEYKIRLFKFITILFGYVEIVKEGFVIHINNIKAVIIKYKSIFKIRKKVKPLKDYHILKFYSNIEISQPNEDNLEFISTILLLKGALDILASNLTIVKPYLTIKNNVNIKDENNIFKLNVRAQVILNLLMIILSFIKIYTEKIIYAIKK